MGSPPQRFVLHRSWSDISVSASLAVLFVGRTLASTHGSASLSGPVWTFLSAVVAIGSLLRCFDRVVVSPDGINSTWLCVPRRTEATRIHELYIEDKAYRTLQLTVETVDGQCKAINWEWRTTQGQERMRRLRDHAQAMLGPNFQPLTPEAAAAQAEQAVAPIGPRRCIRSGCPAYLAEVTATQCEACREPTQRVLA